MSTFGEFTKDGHGEPMAMLPTLPLEKRTELSGNRGLLTKAHFKQSQARLHSPKHEIRLHTRLTMASASGFFTL